MSIAVYPRLSELLRDKQLSVAELERLIKQRFGLTVNPKTLYRFTSSDPVQRADLEIAGAVAAVLGVSLSDLFDIQATPVSQDSEEESVLDSAESRRLAGLFDRQSRGVLQGYEQRELEDLVREYGRRLHEVRVREYAQQRGISLEEAGSEMDRILDQSIAWWQTPEAEIARRDAVQEAKDRDGRANEH
jgi:Cro/C1-type HTH DNA-binding domain